MQRTGPIITLMMRYLIPDRYGLAYPVIVSDALLFFLTVYVINQYHPYGVVDNGRR